MVVSVVSGGVEEIVASFIPEGVFNGFLSQKRQQTPQKSKRKKRLPTGPKMEQDPKQKDTNTQKDTAKGHAGLLPGKH